MLRINESSVVDLKKVRTQKNTILNKLNALESHTASIKQAREERLEAESRAEKFRVERNVLKKKLDQVLRRFGMNTFRLVCINACSIYTTGRQEFCGTQRQVQ